MREAAGSWLSVTPARIVVLAEVHWFFLRLN